jgi:hypothetical protein
MVFSLEKKNVKRVVTQPKNVTLNTRGQIKKWCTLARVFKARRL